MKWPYQSIHDRDASYVHPVRNDKSEKIQKKKHDVFEMDTFGVINELR